MKRLITFLMLCVFSVPAFAATKMYVSTEKVYGFSTENLAETIPEFIEDEKKQNAVADKYTELMDENGNVSVADLFEICRTAGFNTYREAGFQQCSLFMAKLAENAEIELEFTTLSGYCPGADEKGNNPNGLRSINEYTRIGDFCSSTNISAGTVIFRKGYNCTCLSYSCNPGFDLIKGACKEKIADESGNCLAFKATFPDWLPSSIIEDNEQYKDSANNIQEIFENICRGEANKTKGGCKIFGAVPIYSEKYVGCNPPENLIQLYKQGVEAKQNEYSLKDQERQKKLVKGLKYYEVCGKDKGKTGKSEHCVSDFFAETNVQTTGAIGLAQAYARVKDKREIHCDTNYRAQSNDDYIKCSTMDGTHLYEFKFDDVVERKDSTREASTMSALCRLVNGTFYPANLNNAGYSTPEICKGITKDVCDTTLRNLGDNLAVFSSWRRYGVSSVAECVMEMKGSKRRLENTLKTIENLDNRAFYNLQVQALEGSYNLIDYMEKYVRKQKPNTISFKCDAGYVSAVTVDGWTAFMSDTDDVLRCYVDGKPIDFVFNDLSETFPYQRDAGQEGSVCISMNANTGKPNMIPTNGTYDGHYCRGITRAECEQLQKQVMEELKHHGWHGDDDIVDWDDSADACEINSAQFSRNVNKVATYVAIAGTTILGFFSGGTSWALTASLVSVELAGIAGEIYTDRKKELLPAEWARDFIEQSKNCNDSSCALAVIKGNLNKISQSPGMINPETVTKVDTEMSRLAELMSDAEFEEAVANADELSGWDTWDNQAKIFGFMQMATLGTGVVSGLRGFAKVMGRRLGKAALTKGATKTVTGAVDAATDASKTAKNIGLFNKTTGAPLDRNDILALIKKDAGASYDDIGISVTKNGKLQDLRAAKGKPLFISNEEALNRIQENLAKRWDDVDVKVTIGKDGKTYFYDNKAKGFASHETLRTRIGESVGKTTDKATDAAADAGKTASGAGKTAESATGAGKTAGKAAETATGAGKTANTAEKAKTVVYNAEHFKTNPSAADDIFKNADNGIVQVNRQNMPASTARDLMKKAREHGFACSDCGGEVLIFSRTKKATDAAADAGKTASGAGKTAETATGAGKRAATDGSVKVGKDGRYYDVSTGENIAPISKFNEWKNQNMTNGFVIEKGALTESEVSTLANKVAKEGGYLQRVGDEIIIRKPGKTGFELKKALNDAGIKAYRVDDFYGVKFRSGEQCASGLKFHVSVDVEDLEKASFIVNDLVKNSDVADIWKVATDGMGGMQKGKDFTIYVSKSGYNQDKIRNFVDNLESALKRNNIRSNGRGSNVANGDKAIKGSDYINYRYDRTNNLGIPDGKYNDSYKFVAPTEEYGGDIMKGISL